MHVSLLLICLLYDVSLTNVIKGTIIYVIRQISMGEIDDRWCIVQECNSAFCPLWLSVIFN